MSTSVSRLYDQLELADQLLAGRDSMLEPQDLPGRYGRAVSALDHVLQAIDAEAVVWRHGYIGRVTHDIDVVLGLDDLPEFLRVAAVSGFDVLTQQPGRWPKLVHRDTGIDVDILPEGERPGTPSRPAPTTIRPPGEIGASGPRLRYVSLAPLIEMKLAAGRARDESDVVELLRANPQAIGSIRRHLLQTNPAYAVAFDALANRAREEPPG